MNTDDFTQPLESVMRQERMAVYPLPLKIQDRIELFQKWCELNPQTLRSIELTALAIHQRGLRVSAKYLIEKQRYEGSYQLTGVPFLDGSGREHLYAINNTDTPLLSRWLLDRHPSLNIELRKSIYETEKEG
jgi:hypothetical protein